MRYNPLQRRMEEHFQNNIGRSMKSHPGKYGLVEQVGSGDSFRTRFFETPEEMQDYRIHKYGQNTRATISQIVPDHITRKQSSIGLGAKNILDTKRAMDKNPRKDLLVGRTHTS